jgi:hypothetical protein
VRLYTICCSCCSAIVPCKCCSTIVLCEQAVGLLSPLLLQLLLWALIWQRLTLLCYFVLLGKPLAATCLRYVFQFSQCWLHMFGIRPCKLAVIAALNCIAWLACTILGIRTCTTSDPCSCRHRIETPGPNIRQMATQVAITCTARSAVVFLCDAFAARHVCIMLSFLLHTCYN